MHEVWPARIRVADGAEHIFEAYTSPAAILRNQKRQVIGQTIVHILVDWYLKGLPLTERRQLGAVVRARESADPFWLKRLITEHLRRTRYFWRLYPGLVTVRFQRLKGMSLPKRLACLPAAFVATLATVFSSFLAYRALKTGCTDYWPKAKRFGLSSAQPHPAAPAEVPTSH
jgi:hypothetical protein